MDMSGGSGSMNVSIIRHKGRSRHRTPDSDASLSSSQRCAHQPSVLTEAMVAEDGTPPVDIDATTLLSDVVRLLDNSMDGSGKGFTQFYRRYMVSAEAKRLLVDSFWYVSVCLFDHTNKLAAAALLKRLSRTYSVFVYGMAGGKHKDFFLQYFPYTIVQAIDRGYRTYFPSSGHLYTTAFFERVHAIICTLFVHDSGGGHGRRLREALREKLFSPKKGKGPPPPPLPDLDTAHCMATNWSDIVSEELPTSAFSSEVSYKVVAKRAGGPAARSPSPELSPGKRSRRRPKAAGNTSVGPGGMRGGAQDMNESFHFPRAELLVQDAPRPTSAEFDLNTYNDSRSSPLVGSYLHEELRRTPDNAVPTQFVPPATGDSDEEDADKLVFRATTGIETQVAEEEPEQRPHTSASGAGKAAGNRSANRSWKQAQAEKNAMHVSGLASALGLGQETLGPLGSGKKAEHAYHRLTRLHGEAIRKERRAKHMLQREAESKRDSVILGGKKEIASFCFSLAEQREKELELKRLVSKQKKSGRSGRSMGEHADQEQRIKGTLANPAGVQGMQDESGNTVVASMFDAEQRMGTKEARRRARDTDENLFATEDEHMLYDRTKFKNSATRRAAAEAGGGAPPAPERPATMRELRRSPSPDFKIHHERQRRVRIERECTAVRWSCAGKSR